MLDEALNLNLQTTKQLQAVSSSSERAATDKELVQAVLAGDESGFAELFDRYKRHVTHTAAKFFRDRTDIEECVQRSFTKAYFSLSHFRGGEDASFVAWLTRITVNSCYDEFRRRQRRGESLDAELSDDELDYLDTVLDGKARSAEDRVIAVQLAEKVLAGLSAEDRMAVTLVYSEDHTLAEVADVLGVSVNNLKSRLFRCRNNLKNRFRHLIK